MIEVGVVCLQLGTFASAVKLLGTGDNDSRLGLEFLILDLGDFVGCLCHNNPANTPRVGCALAS